MFVNVCFVLCLCRGCFLDWLKKRVYMVYLRGFEVFACDWVWSFWGDPEWLTGITNWHSWKSILCMIILFLIWETNVARWQKKQSWMFRWLVQSTGMQWQVMKPSCTFMASLTNGPVRCEWLLRPVVHRPGFQSQKWQSLFFCLFLFSQNTGSSHSWQSTTDINTYCNVLCSNLYSGSDIKSVHQQCLVVGTSKILLFTELEKDGEYWGVRQRRYTWIFNSPLQLTVSKTLVTSTEAVHRMFCFLHFSCNCPQSQVHCDFPSGANHPDSGPSSL